MRILVLIHEYPPVGGGGGRVAQDLCQRLVSAGYEVHLLTARCGDLPALEQQGNLIIERLPSMRREMFRADLRAMAGFVLAAFWRGLQVVRGWKPDVIHAHFAVPAGAVAFILSVLSGTPYVLTAHLGDVPGGVPEKTGRWFRYLFPSTPPIWKRAARVVAVSAYTRSLALKSYPVPVEVIPNGVDLNELDPGEIRLNQPPRILFAGRFMPQKNPLQVVRTLACLKDLPWSCVMMGDGPLRSEVEAEIANMFLQERITLTGWITPQEVLDGYRRGDILFLPSLSEGLPVVGVQAMALGLSLVLSAAGGSVELVSQGENGYLVDLKDPGGFEAALRALLCDPQKLLSARLASRRLAQAYDLGKVVAAYEKVFEGIKVYKL